MKNEHHHVEFINLPELKPLELYGLFRISRFMEPYTNRLVMMCEIQTVSDGKVIRREIKSVGIRSGDIPGIIGCSTMTANKIMKVLKEKNIVRKEKTFYVNPKYVRVHNSLGTGNTVALFSEASETTIEPPPEISEPDESAVDEDDIN